MTIEGPVNQYDMYGYFLQEYPSVEEASKAIQGKSDQIQRAALGEKTNYKGFQWRYQSEVSDQSTKIGVANYVLDDEVMLLFYIWSKIRHEYHFPVGKYVESEIEMWEPWKNSFDVFYYDMIDDFRKVVQQNLEDQEELEPSDVVMVRTNEEKGWAPGNVTFITPK